MGWPDPHTMGGITRKRLVVMLLCVSSAKAHITLISFPLFTYKTQSQVFRASTILIGQKSLGAKDHSFFFFFFSLVPVCWSKVTNIHAHTYADHISVYLLKAHALTNKHFFLCS